MLVFQRGSPVANPKMGILKPTSPLAEKSKNGAAAASASTVTAAEAAAVKNNRLAEPRLSDDTKSSGGSHYRCVLKILVELRNYRVVQLHFTPEMEVLCILIGSQGHSPRRRRRGDGENVRETFYVKLSRHFANYDIYRLERHGNIGFRGL